MGGAYYNDTDPAAAHILRVMIDNGVIAPGDVDTRSIKDVMPDDLSGYTQCHFFAGGGLWSVAARLAGWPDDRPLWTGSCPCQPFSAAGKGLGTDDPRHLWPDFHRLIRARRPAAVMGEQVAGKAGYGWFDGVRSDLESEGYSGRAVDFPACSVDAPHQRNRLYWIAVDVADSDSFGSSAHGRHAGEVRSFSEAQCGSEYDAALPRRGDGAPFQCVPGSREGGSLDNGLRSRLEGHAGHGDGSGRQEARRPVATADGASSASVSSHAALSVVQGQPSAGQQPHHRADASLHADADNHRRDGQGLSARPGWERLPNGARNPQRNGSYWSGAEWIECHDGKARRTEPGIRFLVDGLPGRVDLWRVGGNAIVPQAAAEVIAAFMDVYGVPKIKESAA